MYEKIKFLDEDGEEIEFFVLEQTRVSGVNYLLVTDSMDDDDAVALIVKDISNESDSEAVYDIVTDDEEMSALAKIFNELLEDTELE